MKNSVQVLTHLVTQPQYKKLAQQKCIDTILELFAPHLREMVVYAYFRKSTLYFVLNHPGAKQEFDFKIQSIKTPLKNYPPLPCQEFELQNIRTYVSHEPPKKESSEEIKVENLYEERAEGHFENSVKDEKLHKIIEKIRTSIHDNKD